MQPDGTRSAEEQGEINQALAWLDEAIAEAADELGDRQAAGKVAARQREGPSMKLKPAHIRGGLKEIVDSVIVSCSYDRVFFTDALLKFPALPPCPFSFLLAGREPCPPLSAVVDGTEGRMVHHRAHGG